MEVVVTTAAIRRAKLRSKSHHQQTQLFTGQMPFLSPNQQCQSTEGKAVLFTSVIFLWKRSSHLQYVLIAIHSSNVHGTAQTTSISIRVGSSHQQRMNTFDVLIFHGHH